MVQAVVYSETVNRTLSYIEAHLKEELNLEILAERAAFSMYHFHRIFQAQVGMPPADYIRRRRLSSAACSLLGTERRILDIALEYRFDSQESFTRSFKRMFLMTPGQYRSYYRTLTMQKESEAEMAEQADQMNALQGEPRGWMLTGTHTGDYEMGVDRLVVHHGKSSGYLRSLTERASGFGTMMQMFKADAYLGSRLRLSGFVKTEQVRDWCGLWLRVDGKDHDVLGFDNMSGRPVRGTTGWSRYSLVLDVPKESVAIAFGVLLNGSGRVWIDSLQFDTVSLQVPVTSLEEVNALPDAPVNLNFEEEPGL
ncbi:AraC family transcriptional regulator [Paenibacillus chitinolyticus]|uniref:helix-turn-helix domain-containing protein n=1 Tax=Paenibacillus chitinolyticus TaxID=79263 RepID=UPI0026E503DA|nr:helix-turn-helix domain-containing protein [Paenibacillus chitinolyticus]GKS12030.1 AraC family transcriptional regulator [Paenibacillus chitinolyticus]